MKSVEEIVTLNVAEKGLRPYIYDWYIEEEVTEYDGDLYFLKDGGYGRFEPNCTWFAVQVRRRDVKRYLDLYNEYLECCWTPNQDWETREANGKRIKELKSLMRSLEVKADERT